MLLFQYICEKHLRCDCNIFVTVNREICRQKSGWESHVLILFVFPASIPFQFLGSLQIQYDGDKIYVVILTILIVNVIINIQITA